MLPNDRDVPRSVSDWLIGMAGEIGSVRGAETGTVVVAAIDLLRSAVPAEYAAPSTSNPDHARQEPGENNHSAIAPATNAGQIPWGF
jgi:hypothetical protein